MTQLHPATAELIAASLDRPLTAGEREEVDRHTVGCGACRHLELRLRRDAAALSVPIVIVPPPAIRAEIERRVAIPPLDPTLLRVLRIAVTAALVLILIVALAIGLALLQPRSSSPEGDRGSDAAGLHQWERAW